MRRVAAILAAALASSGAAAAFVDPEAQKILGQGKWGLITEDLSPQAAEKARSCDGTSISFGFTVSEVQLITYPNGSPPSGPPLFFGKLTGERDDAFLLFKLYAEEGDAKPALIFSYDPSVKALMALGADGDGTALYVLCRA